MVAGLIAVEGWAPLRGCSPTGGCPAVELVFWEFLLWDNLFLGGRRPPYWPQWPQ